MKVTILAALAFVLGYIARDYRPDYFPISGDPSLYIGPTKKGDMQVLQLNLNGRPLGWMEITPEIAKSVKEKMDEIASGAPKTHS
jgi:hypothetical protein